MNVAPGSTHAQRNEPSLSYMPSGDPGPGGGGTYTNRPTDPTIKDYENIFGPSARDIKDDLQKFKRHGRWHLPDVLKGPQPWLTDRVDGLITDATNSPFTTFILPYKYIENVDGKIKWNVWSFDEGLASRVPYEAAARTLTQSKRSYAGYAVRHGLAINLEHNFMMTPKGRENFNNQLLQLVGSIQMSNDLDVHMALILAPSYEKEMRNKFYSTGKTPGQVCREYVDLFGFLQKNANGLDILIEESKSRLRTWGGPMPDFMLTNTKLCFQLQMIPDRTNYLTQGPDGVRRLKEGPTLSSYRGIKIIETRAFSMETGQAPRDMLRRRVRVAEYYRITPDPNNYKREFEVYDESRDNWFTLSFRDLLKMALLPDEPHDGGTYQGQNHILLRQAFDNYYDPPAPPPAAHGPVAAAASMAALSSSLNKLFSSGHQLRRKGPLASRLHNVVSAGRRMPSRALTENPRFLGAPISLADLKLSFTSDLNHLFNIIAQLYSGPDSSNSYWIKYSPSETMIPIQFGPRVSDGRDIFLIFAPGSMGGLLNKPYHGAAWGHLKTFITDVCKFTEPYASMLHQSLDFYPNVTVPHPMALATNRYLYTSVYGREFPRSQVDLIASRLFRRYAVVTGTLNAQIPATVDITKQHYGTHYDLATLGNFFEPNCFEFIRLLSDEQKTLHSFLIFPFEICEFFTNLIHPSTDANKRKFLFIHEKSKVFFDLLYGIMKKHMAPDITSAYFSYAVWVEFIQSNLYANTQIPQGKITKAYNQVIPFWTLPSRNIINNTSSDLCHHKHPMADLFHAIFYNKQHKECSLSLKMDHLYAAATHYINASPDVQKRLEDNPLWHKVSSDNNTEFHKTLAAYDKDTFFSDMQTSFQLRLLGDLAFGKNSAYVIDKSAKNALIDGDSSSATPVQSTLLMSSSLDQDKYYVAAPGTSGYSNLVQAVISKQLVLTPRYFRQFTSTSADTVFEKISPDSIHGRAIDDPVLPPPTYLPVDDGLIRIFDENIFPPSVISADAARFVNARVSPYFRARLTELRSASSLNPDQIKELTRIYNFLERLKDINTQVFDNTDASNISIDFATIFLEVPLDARYAPIHPPPPEDAPDARPGGGIPGSFPVSGGGPDDGGDGRPRPADPPGDASGGMPPAWGFSGGHSGGGGGFGGGGHGGGYDGEGGGGDDGGGVGDGEAAEFRGEADALEGEVSNVREILAHLRQILDQHRNDTGFNRVIDIEIRAITERIQAIETLAAQVPGRFEHLIANNERLQEANQRLQQMLVQLSNGIIASKEDDKRLRTDKHHPLLDKIEIVIVRPNIEHYMLGIIMGLGGESLGNTLWGQTELSVYDDSMHGVWGMSYKYHERAIVFSEKNLIRLWDIAYDGYTGGKDDTYVNWRSPESVEKFKSDTMDVTRNYSGSSMMVMGFVHDETVMDTDGRSLYTQHFQRNWPSPILFDDNYNHAHPGRYPVNATVGYDNLDVLDVSGFRVFDRPIYEPYKFYRAHFPRFYELHMQRKDAGQSTQELETTTDSLAFQGTMRIKEDGRVLTEILGSGHHGPDYVGAASIRAGKGYKMVPGRPMLQHLV